MRTLVSRAALLVSLVVVACSGDETNATSGGSGGGAAASGASGTGGSGCPPECFAPTECVKECGDAPTNYGCCGCPPGMIDVLTCNADAGDDAAGCGLIGTPCPGRTTCGAGLHCEQGVCAHDSSACAAPPDGVGCAAGESCLQYTGMQDGLCVSDADKACLCAGTAANAFECP